MQEVSKRKTVVAFWVVLAALAALTSATYAWMRISTAPSVTDISLSAITENPLELAPDVDGAPGQWGSLLEIAENPDDTQALRPVTYTNARQEFVIPKHGIDGRVDLSTLTPVDLSSGDVFSFDFWIRAGAGDCTVSLSSPVRRDEDGIGNGTYVIGKPVWDVDSRSHIDGGKGAQNAVRIGLLVHETGDDGLSSGPTRFIVYEPNADSSGEYLPTVSSTGTQTLVPVEDLILQGTSSWSENSPVLHGTVKYSVGDFLSDTRLFDLRSGQARRVTLYIWLEGMDVDCKNSVSAAAIAANLQFTGRFISHDEDITAR